VGHTACTQPQCLYKGALYLYLTVELYLYSPCGPYGLYTATVPVQGCTTFLIVWVTKPRTTPQRLLDCLWHRNRAPDLNLCRLYNDDDDDDDPYIHLCAIVGFSTIPNPLDPSSLTTRFTTQFNSKIIILSDYYRLSLPAANTPRVRVVGLVAYVKRTRRQEVATHSFHIK
jgi:hypothetical protein